MHNERPSFPDDALSADDRKALRDNQQRKAWLRSQAIGLGRGQYNAARYIAEQTQRRELERLRRRWINGFVWGASLAGLGPSLAAIIAFASVGAW